MKREGGAEERGALRGHGLGCGKSQEEVDSGTGTEAVGVKRRDEEWRHTLAVRLQGAERGLDGLQFLWGP